MKRRRLLLIVAMFAPAAGLCRLSAQSPPPLRCGAGIHAGEAAGQVWFPEGDLFCPLLADPKAERSFASYLRGEFPAITDGETNADIGAVGLGDRFALVR